MTEDLASIDKRLEEVVLSDKEVYAGKLLHVHRREVRLPDGRKY